MSDTECTKKDPCEKEGCQICCPHDSRDHGICLDCEHDGFESMMADAYDKAKDARKYGDT
jgi:hypothetical protein